MGKVFTQVKFVDRDLQGKLLECSYDLYSFLRLELGEQVTVGRIVGNQPAEFWYDEDNKQLKIDLPEHDFAVLEVNLDDSAE